MIAGVLGRLAENSKGNVAVLFALSAMPIVFLVGMGVDYTSAVLREDQLNADADAAALAALRPALMAQADSASILAAQTTFNAQASTVAGINYNSSTGLTVTAADT